MLQRLVKAVITISLTILSMTWLVACSTAPQSVATQAYGSTAMATVPVQPDVRDAATGVAPISELPASDESAPLMLAGEMPRELQRGGASWYGPRFHGRRTASGERYDMQAFTAAHRTLPFGTRVRVKSLVNGREVEVRITDRGPFSRGRIIDVSRAAAVELDMLGMGIKNVVLFVSESTPPVAEQPVRTISKPRKPARSQRAG